MKKLLYIPFLLPIYSQAQNNYDLHKQVLKKGIVDSEFVFGKWDGDKGNDETHIKYLGQVTTKKGKAYNIITSSWYWGLSPRATSRILIFDHQNRYVGQYYVGMVTDLPSKLVNGKLIFDNSERRDCNKRLKTIVDLAKGLPKQFFLKCKGGRGDIYSFESF